MVEGVVGSFASREGSGVEVATMLRWPLGTHVGHFYVRLETV